ncbi:hypothetical protein F5Y06DRAFT_157778 [Hypoxylon sp. FL0890]|nr:hypothetical protein F5Y06DRAFT_157778 [Hypoxylon sp. FL0890]
MNGERRHGPILRAVVDPQLSLLVTAKQPRPRRRKRRLHQCSRYHCKLANQRGDLDTWRRLHGKKDPWCPIPLGMPVPSLPSYLFMILFIISLMLGRPRRNYYQRRSTYILREDAGACVAVAVSRRFQLIGSYPGSFQLRVAPRSEIFRLARLIDHLRLVNQDSVLPGGRYIRWVHGPFISEPLLV